MIRTIIMVLWLLLPLQALADVIYFKSGREVETARAWEEGEFVKCYIEGGTVSYPKAIVTRIEEKEHLLPAPAPNQNAAAEPKKDDSSVTQTSTFTFDGFEWQVLNVYRYPMVGRPENLQRPKNGCFIIVESSVVNISNKARYCGDALLIAGGQQFSESTTVSVYAEHNLGYDSNDSTKLEPGAAMKTFFGFDARDSDENILVLKPFIGSNETPVRLKITSIRRRDV